VSYRRRDGKATKKKKKKKSSREKAGAPTVPYVWETVYRTGVVRGDVACVETTQGGRKGQQVPSVRISAGQGLGTDIAILGPILGLIPP
jgi:hypothetical protein